MTKNIMIVGVGGQGTLLASRIIGKTVIKEGYDVKISEVICQKCNISYLLEVNKIKYLKRYILFPFL